VSVTTAYRPASKRRTAAIGRSSVALTGMCGVLSFLALWWVGSERTRFIPPITEVVSEIPAFLSDSSIYQDIGISLLRVVVALAIALAVGLMAALVMARGNFWGRVVGRYVELAIGLPSTIAALLALFIFKRSEVGVFLVVALATFPFVAINLRQGLQAAGANLAGMASVYHFGSRRTLRHVLIPHLVPYSLSSVRNEYAHAWRVVVLAEVFSVNSGIGRRFIQAYDRFLLVDVCLWLLTFMVLLLGTEYFVLRPLERFVLRWRGGDV
jgi:NitT/TauT family transport system permease protein